MSLDISYYIVDPVTGQRVPSDQYGTPLTVSYPVVPVMVSQQHDQYLQSEYKRLFLDISNMPYISEQEQIAFMNKYPNEFAKLHQQCCLCFYGDQVMYGIYVAIVMHRLMTIKRMLELGVDPCFVDDNGNTAISFARAQLKDCIYVINNMINNCVFRQLKMEQYRLKSYTDILNTLRYWRYCRQKKQYIIDGCQKVFYLM